MKLSVVLSTHAAAFEAVAFKGDLEAGVAKIAGWGYDGVELAIRDPRLVDPDELEPFMPAATKTIELEEFVDLDEIDPVYFDSAYYVAPGSNPDHDVSALLRKMQGYRASYPPARASDQGNFAFEWILFFQGSKPLRE